MLSHAMHPPFPDATGTTGLFTKPADIQRHMTQAPGRIDCMYATM